ncbi:MAG: TrpR-like protein YerC/YecD [Peptococcaceae bacterium]|jgi:TrpR-related protein YerC/YecD|nr:TrpR-like protein YerC/YecD [Peptococcaceae bacterium]
MRTNDRLRNRLTDSLFEAVLLLKDREECYRFFEDIATIAEIKALAQRLEVAKLLLQKETYTTIAEHTGASTATISRVKNCLFFGADGYQLILDRLDERSAEDERGAEKAVPEAQRQNQREKSTEGYGG